MKIDKLSLNGIKNVLNAELKKMAGGNSYGCAPCGPGRHNY
jgi:hypothetical protein